MFRKELGCCPCLFYHYYLRLRISFQARKRWGVELSQKGVGVLAREAYTFTTFPKNFIKKFFILQYYSKVLLSLPKNLETMALNTFWKVEDLEGHTEDSYWKSEGFFEKIGTNKKAFEERYRLNELRGREEDDPRTPLKGIIFNNRWRVSIIIMQGMKFKTCNCPEY